MLTVDDCIFYSAAEAGRTYCRKVAEIVKAQPGYTYKMGYPYRFGKTEDGSIRLYACVDRQWIDASLHDIDGLDVQ